MELLTINRNGPIRVIWAPFDFAPASPDLVLVGITPGRFQAEMALTAFSAALEEGLDVDGALRRVKTAASFSGPLRRNLVAMLDHIGLHVALGIDSCAELFQSTSERVHLTSAIRYPVFIDGANYSGAPAMLRTPILRRWIETTLADEVRSFARALWVPLGPKPAEALEHLAQNGMMKRANILAGLPHPSGANAERIAFFLGRKSRSNLSRNTDPQAIEDALGRLRRQIAAFERAGR